MPLIGPIVPIEPMVPICPIVPIVPMVPIVPIVPMVPIDPMVPIVVLVSCIRDIPMPIPIISRECWNTPCWLLQFTGNTTLVPLVTLGLGPVKNKIKLAYETSKNKYFFEIFYRYSPKQKTMRIMSCCLS